MSTDPGRTTFRRAFITEPLLRTARRYADLDLLQRADDDQIAWLFNNPVWWLRALVQIEVDVNSHIAKARAALAALRPPDGTHPSMEYLTAKRECDEQSVRRMHFHRKVERRRAEVVSIFGTDFKTTATPGDVVARLLLISQFIEDDDVTNARDMLLRLAEQLGAQHA